MAVTISDVAKAAGVSASTVSRALTRPERVDAETKARIFAQIERLGYKVNRAARGLVTGRTSNLGGDRRGPGQPVLPGHRQGDPAPGPPAQPHDAAGRLGGGPRRRAEPGRQPGAAGRRDRAVRLAGCRTSSSPRPSSSRRSCWSTAVHAGVPAVTVDNADGMRQAVRHLRALRHRRIGYVGGPVTSRSHHDRLAGARRAAADNGLELIELGNVDPSFGGGAAAADSVLLAEVSAVLTYNDVIAIGLMHRLVGYGVRVPDEISVVGFDDIPLAEMTYPPLTTVRFPRREAGEAGRRPADAGPRRRGAGGRRRTAAHRAGGARIHDPTSDPPGGQPCLSPPPPTWTSW